MSTANDLFYCSEQFQTFFKLSRRSLVVKAVAPFFDILAVSDDYLRLIDKARIEVLNKSIFTTLPEQKGIDDGRKLLEDGFLMVIETKKSFTSTVFNTNITDLETGNDIKYYYRITNDPVLSVQDEVEYIISTISDITAEIKASSKRENQELQLMQVLDMLPAHVVIIEGEELIVESINESNLKYWDRSREEVIGKRFLDILPDLADQPFAGQLRRVMETGETLEVKESPVLFEMPDGSIRETYVDYKYQAIKDSSGRNSRVLVMSFEITDRVASRKLLESYTSELQKLNGQLQVTNSDLALSESRFKYLIQEAPVAIGILAGKELIVEIGNQKILEVWGKTRSIIGLPLAQALPEIQGQPFLDLLDDVFTTGKAFYANEIRAMLEHDGIMTEIFFNVVYQPIKDVQQITTDILVVAADVTEQVNARKQVEQAELKLRLAVDGANLGTFSFDIASGKQAVSSRLNELYGLTSQAEPSLAELFELVTPEFRSNVSETVQQCISTGESLDISYQILNPNERETRWIRMLGNMGMDNANNFVAFTGVVMDITEQKQDEQRKNDFIGMVSHELKTPITSLNGYLQLLNKKANDAGDEFAKGALDKSLNQIKRMTTMINGFLNLSRLESGKIHIDRLQFDLAKLVVDVESETLLTLNTHHIIFAPVEETFIVGDRDKIGQVIINFISNAVKYSPMGSTINVACISTDGTALLSVRDSGIGIKPEHQKHLFDRYYRVEDPSTKTIPGFGIGLYLCAEIITRHEGKIWLDSIPNEGTTFYFSLPIQRD